MGYIFICKKCGDIKSIDWKVGTRHLTCNKCAEPMDWSNAFPPQSVIDFRNTVDSLFKLSKEHDKENLDTHYDFLKNHFDKFDKTQLDKYINNAKSNGGRNVKKPKLKRFAEILKARFNKSSIHSSKPSATPKNEVISAKAEKIFTTAAIMVLPVITRTASINPFNVGS